MQMLHVKSSFIHSIGYNANTRTAMVEFKSGRTYTYANVHPITFTRWIKSPSKGKYFHRNIKHQHTYQAVA